MPRQVTSQEQRVAPGTPCETAAAFHQPLLRAGQRPLVDPETRGRDVGLLGMAYARVRFSKNALVFLRGPDGPRFLQS